MQVIYWIYNHICAKHPKVAEAVLIVVSIVVIHFAFAYIRDTAATQLVEPQPRPLKNIVTTSGDKSPAIVGHDNSVVYEDGQPKDDDSKKKEK
jgi:hypothetical protein